MNTLKNKRKIQKKILKKKAKKQKTVRTKVKKSTKILLMLMFVYFVYKYISLEIQYQHLVQQRDALRAEIEATQKYQEELLQQVENNQSEEYIEDLARRYLGLVYPDEKIFKEVEGQDFEEKE